MVVLVFENRPVRGLRNSITDDKKTIDTQHDECHITGVVDEIKEHMHDMKHTINKPLTGPSQDTHRCNMFWYLLESLRHSRGASHQEACRE